MEIWISKSIKKIHIENKGYGFIAATDIPKNTVIMRDIPINDICKIKTNELQMYYVLYEIFINKKLFEIFKTLTPFEKDEHILKYSTIISQIKKIQDTKIKKFMTEIDKNEMEMYCTKYIRNAFNFNGNNRDKIVMPAILINGAIFNHSCVPNVYFKPEDKHMLFITNRKIKKGEELCDFYCDLELPCINRKKRLLEQYGFDCKCDKCTII